MAKQNNGSKLEGLLIEVGGLIQQDTDGKFEFKRKKTTNEPDGGIDGEGIIKPELDIFEYFDQLLKKNDDSSKE